MNKVKLTKAQVDAINKALSHYGDAERLVDIHRKIMNLGHKWSSWTALNDVAPKHLYMALHYGYEVDEQSSPQAPRKIHPIAVLVRKEKAQRLTKKALEAELDYELASLHYAIQQHDQAEIERSKKRLVELHKELDLEPVLEGF